MDEARDIITRLDNIISMFQEWRDTIAPNQIVTTGLSEISTNLGLIQAGEFRAGNRVDPGSTGGFVGVRIGFPPFTYGGEDWNIVGVNRDVMQFGLRASDGVAVAGGGVVRLGADGIIIDPGSAEGNTLSWIDPDTDDYSGRIYSISGGMLLEGNPSGDYASSNVTIAATKGSTRSDLSLSADGTNNEMELTFGSGPFNSVLKITDGEFVINDASLDMNFRLETDSNANFIFIDAGTSKMGIGGVPTLGLVHVWGDIVMQDDSANPELLVYSHSDTQFRSPVLEQSRARNTSASPNAIQSGDRIGLINFKGHNGTIFDVGASIFVGASENWGGAAQGTRVRFTSTPNGQTADIRYISFENNQIIINESKNDLDFVVHGDTLSNLIFADGGSDLVGIGKAPAYLFHVGGEIALSELSADPSDPAEGNAVMWMSDGTGAGDDGDLMCKITAGGSTKTATIVDFSTV